MIALLAGVAGLLVAAWPRRGPAPAGEAAGAVRSAPVTDAASVTGAASGPRRSGTGTAILAAVAVAGFAAGLGVALLPAVPDPADTERAIRLTGGDPEAGRALLRAHACIYCHTIPGVGGADGSVGPNLGGHAGRLFLGGTAYNTPDMLVRWIRDPRSVDPQADMPATGASEREARDIAAFLYTLR